MFVDKVTVTLKAGDGGDGIVSFRHEKFRQFGGPDGGDGGDGGNVILRASRNQNTLAALRYKKLLKAADGQDGKKAKKHGRSGEDLLADVPVGTVVIDASGQQLADFVADGQTEKLAAGGRGGFGNAHFTSSTRQAPRVAEQGDKGDTKHVTLELKMIADVGIVGLPNAGKSTLLSVISNAKPEIADYPFTTLVPNLGVVDIDKKNSLLFADIPGLIAGASEGKGLGDEFLRHIERTSVLLHLIDSRSQNIAEDYRTVMDELRNYSVDLSGEPQIIALSKIDGLEPKQLDGQKRKLLKILPKGTNVLAFSSLSRDGLRPLLYEVKATTAKASKRQTQTASKTAKIPVIGLKASDDDWTVEQSGSSYIITGKKIERFAARTKFGDPHGEERLKDILRKEGVIRELERRGIASGQQVVIGAPAIGELEY